MIHAGLHTTHPRELNASYKLAIIAATETRPRAVHAVAPGAAMLGAPVELPAAPVCFAPPELDALLPDDAPDVAAASFSKPAVTIIGDNVTLAWSIVSRLVPGSFAAGPPMLSEHTADPAIVHATLMVNSFSSRKLRMYVLLLLTVTFAPGPQPQSEPSVPGGQLME